MKTDIDIKFYEGVEYTLLREKEGGYYSIRNNFTGEEVPADEDTYINIFPEAYERMMNAAERQARSWAKDLAKQLRQDKGEKPNESN